MSSAYRVDEQPDGVRVVGPEGDTVLQCRERHSADHYVELLNRAHGAGYRSGYRAARQAAGKSRA